MFKTRKQPFPNVLEDEVGEMKKKIISGNWELKTLPESSTRGAWTDYVLKCVM